MKLAGIWWTLLPPAAVFGCWEALVYGGVLDPLFFPAPSVLVAAGGRMIAAGELTESVAATLSRMATGFLAGALGGLLLGLGMGAITAVQQALEPVISALNSTPKLTLLPLLMLFLGVGDAARITLIGLSAFLVLAFHGLDAVRGVQATYIEMASNYGAGRWDILRKVYLPASLPQIFTGARLAAGRALVITLAAELIGASDGLGGMIWMAWQTFATERLYVGVITTAALGASLHLMFRLLEARVIPWRVQHERP